jgi:hypothetical protein
MKSAVKSFENVEQSKVVGKPGTLPLHVLKSIEKAINQYENGQTISLSEFKERHFSKK